MRAAAPQTSEAEEGGGDRRSSAAGEDPTTTLGDGVIVSDELAVPVVDELLVWLLVWLDEYEAVDVGLNEIERPKKGTLQRRR